MTLDDLIRLKDDLDETVSSQSQKLVRALSKQKEHLDSIAQNCEVVSAILQAYSSKKSKGPLQPNSFSITTPDLGDHVAFGEWKTNFKSLLRLSQPLLSHGDSESGLPKQIFTLIQRSSILKNHAMFSSHHSWPKLTKNWTIKLLKICIEQPISGAWLSNKNSSEFYLPMLGTILNVDIVKGLTLLLRFWWRSFPTIWKYWKLLFTLLTQLYRHCITLEIWRAFKPSWKWSMNWWSSEINESTVILSCSERYQCEKMAMNRHCAIHIICNGYWPFLVVAYRRLGLSNMLYGT